MHLLQSSAIFCLGLAVASFPAQAQRAGGSAAPLHPPPETDFTATGVCYGDTVVFVNRTTGGAYKYNWTVSDSSGVQVFASADENPSFLFPQMGAYSVKLVADNGHRDSLTREIVIDTVLATAFDITRRCMLGESFFNNRSRCAGNFLWKIDDAAVADSANMIYHFNGGGSRKVTLIASGPYGQDSAVQYVRVFEDVPDATYGIEPVNDSIRFVPWFPGQIETYFWDFADGSTSDLPLPLHRYADSLTHATYLRAQNDCGASYGWLDVTAGQKKHYREVAFRVYPNPAAYALMFEVSSLRQGYGGQSGLMCEVYELLLFDVYGKTVLNLELQTSNLKPVSISHLSPGVYYLITLPPSGPPTKIVVMR